MDPITAFQVASTVIAFVEFSYNLVSEARERYRSPDGTASDVVNLSTIIDDLSGISSQVNNALATSTSRAATASDETLVRLCRECQDITTEIRDALKSLQARGSSKISHAKRSFVVSLKAMWSKGKLENLEQRLQQIRSEMMMAMLVSLWEKEQLQGVNGNEGLSAQVRKILHAVDRTDSKLDEFAKNLESKFKDFAKDLEAMASIDDTLGPAKRKVLFRNLWEADWRPSNAHLEDKFQLSPGKHNLDAAIQTQIIRSLYFPGIEAREKGISEPYQATYQWIFRNGYNGQGSSAGERNSFTRWLKDQSSNVYWITGKPGSGKSTLMNFIVHSPLTEKHLQVWTGNLPLLLGHYYFWEAGQDKLQRSREGLMRTLLWQCLRSRPGMIPRVTPRRWTVHHVLRGLETPAPAWSWDELQEAFSILASANGEQFKLAIFLDGLDEFEGEPMALIQFVQGLVTQYGIKMCVGSRPWTDFADAFDQYPMLTMQSLTHMDISSYTRGNFQSSKAFQERQALSPDQANALLQEISTKAQGVFLWVFLVVRDLMYSLSKGRSLSQLQAIVNDLPTDLFELYSRMRERVEPQDITNSARYYRLMIASLKPLQAVTLWMADGEDLPEGGVFSDEMRENMIKILNRRLDSSTKGLLELGENGIVNFLHRTARYWVLQNATWQELCTQSPMDFDPNLVFLEVLTKQLSEEKLYQDLGFPQLAFWDLVILGFLYSSQVVDFPSINPRLVQAIDEFDAALSERAASLGQKGYIFNSNSALPQKLSRWSFLRGKGKGKYTANGNGTNHWSWTQGNKFSGSDNCVVGIAAQFAIVPYVRAKVKANKDLIKRGPLLQHTVVGWRTYVPHTFEDLSQYIPVWEGLQEQLTCRRVEMVKILLDLGAPPSNFTTLIDELPQSGDHSKEEIAPQEYWDEVSRLLHESKRRSRFRI